MGAAGVREKIAYIAGLIKFRFMNSSTNVPGPKSRLPGNAVAIALVILGLAAHAADQKADPQAEGKEARASAKAFFDKLVGNWEGDCRTWFKPDVLADEAKVTGQITNA